MKVYLQVMPKSEVLDSEGRAVSRMLAAHQFPLQDCRVGKMIELTLDDSLAPAEVERRVTEMASFVLYNPLIETFKIVATEPGVQR